MIIGYMKLKNVSAGSLIRFENGEFAMISEYKSNKESGHYDGFLHDTGEALHANPNDWVAVISLDQLDADVKDELDYPKTQED